MVNQNAMWLLQSIYIGLPSVIGWNTYEHRRANLMMLGIVIVWEAVTGTSLAYQRTKASNSLLIDVCDHAPHKLPKMQIQKSLTLC